MLILISALSFTCVAILVHYFFSKKLEDVSLPSEMKGSQQDGSKEFLDFTAKFTDKFVKKTNVSFIDGLKRRLVSAGKPMNVSQFMALKFLLLVGLPIAGYIFLPPENSLPLIIISAGVGYILPDLWLSGKIKKRRSIILKDLPYIIDLLNICVGAGLDFMVAVNHVIKEFRACLMIEELKTVVKEIQMGLSRRDALKNLAERTRTPEINSFVRTLLQADRMGSPITTALKMHAEELRMMRFQRGEEMALKAPIKLLFPLLVFILPVVLIIVAGPILIQFTQGGMIKF